MIGLLGGTFDPIHYGHLRPAREVCDQLGLTRLHLVPSAIPPHRQPPVASAKQRFDMADLAAREFPGFVADDREIRRGGVSYTVDTLREMRRELADVPLFFLLGADAFAGLPTWHRWKSVHEMAHLVVVGRPGSPPEIPDWATARVGTVAEFAGRPAGGIVFVSVTPRRISATALRAMIGRGETPTPDVLPSAVWEYIRRNNIYRSAAN